MTDFDIILNDFSALIVHFSEHWICIFWFRLFPTDICLSSAFRVCISAFVLDFVPVSVMKKCALLIL